MQQRESTKQRRLSPSSNVAIYVFNLILFDAKYISMDNYGETSYVIVPAMSTTSEQVFIHF